MMAQKPIFMGCGEDSMAECQKVHERLKEGFEYLSDSQQWTPPGKFGSPSGSTMKEWSEGQKEIQGKIMTVIEDVALALGADIHRMDDKKRLVLKVEILV